MNTSLKKFTSHSPAPARGRGVVRLRHDPGVNIADVCGSSWWGILHGVAQSIHDHGCPSCGEHAISLMRYAHDLVNVSLDKPAFAPEATAEWEPYARQLAGQLQEVHQNQKRRPPKCRFDTATFDTNPGAVSTFMRELAKAQKRGDGEGFVSELNSLCSTVQPRLPLTQEQHPVKISGKCAGTECSLTATAGGKTLTKQPRIKIPITAVTHEGVRRAVKTARQELAEALAEQGGPPVVKPRPAAPRATTPPALWRPPRSPEWPVTDADSLTVEAETWAQLDGERIELKLEVVPIDRVVASNNPQTFDIEPDYPGWLQPRDRGRAANVAQVRTMAANLDPVRLVDDFHTLEAGPPVVAVAEWNDNGGSDVFVDYFVVSGNGRAMAIKLAFTDYPKEYEAYLRAVEKAMGWRAWLLGAGHEIDRDMRKLYPSSTSSKTPSGYMLIRVLDRGLTQERVREIAELGNVAKAIATSSVEQAGIDSAKMTAEFVGQLQPMEDPTASLEQTIRASKNRQWVIQFMRLVPSTEVAAMADDKGRVSESGIKRIVMALSMWTFGVDNGASIAQLAFESTKESPSRNIVQGTLRVVPRFAVLIARLTGFVDNAPPSTVGKAVTMRDELNITPAIGRAILAYVAIRQEGISISDRLAQSGFADAGFGTKYSPMEIELLTMFDINKRSARAISNVFTNYVERAYTAPNPNQAGFGGMIEDGIDYSIEEGDALQMIRQIIAAPAAPGGQGAMLELSKRLTARARRYKIHAEVSTI